MSYERLAQALIETQESMLGQRAINVAQSVPGLAVEDDGTVTDVDGGDDHDRAVVAALVDEYVSIMGQSAHNRLDGAADEFADDLVLPENLGGPADLPAEPDTAGADADPADTAGGADAESTDAASTGVESADAESTTPDAEQSGAEATARDEAVVVPSEAGDAPPDAPVADPDYDPPDPDEIVTNIWGEEHEQADDGTDADPSDVDIESVYITVTDEGGWEKPIPISRAIVTAVTNVTDLDEADLDDLSAYVETHRIVRLLETDQTDPVSFEVEGHAVTLHADGGIHVE